MPNLSHDEKLRIETLLKVHPGLQPLLMRVCNGLNRRGTPTGVLKLGAQLDPVRELEPLRQVFNKRVIVESRAGTVSLNFDRLVADAGDTATADSFLSALYAAVGVVRENLPEQRQIADRETKTMLARLRLRFPALAPVHEELVRRCDYWHQRVETAGVDAVHRLLEQGLCVVNYLELHHAEPVTLSDLGARVCGDSKALRNGELPTLAGNFLALLDEPGSTPDTVARETAWRHRNVVNNPSAIKATIFGPLLYWKGGRQFDWIARLWECGEAATLSWGNVAGIERCEFRTAAGLPPPAVVTCENETPFCHLVRQREPGIHIYTEGYPNAVVLELLRLLRPLELPAKHWGDSDLDGLRIADILNRVYPLTLWRCDLPELQRLESCLKPLAPKSTDTAAKFLHNHPDFPFATELSHTLKHGWLEQESWR